MAYRSLHAVVVAVVLQAGVAAFVLSPSAQAESSIGAAESQSIQATVQRQFDAFDRDDADAAFAQASSAARTRFGTPERFMAMVREQYQPVYRRRRVIFTEVQRVDGLIIQSVRVTDADDRVWVALYRMEREPDGQWRILGCQLVQTRSVST